MAAVLKARARVIRWLLVSMMLELAVAQAPDPGNYSAAQFVVDVRYGVRIPMRDGEQLAVDLYSPRTVGKSPVILTITPYGREGFAEKARWFAQRGYVFAMANSRGRFESGGTWDPFDARHGIDGYDLVEWLASQPWSNGNVGMWGPSYMGWAQWWTASTAPPHLKAIAPWSTPADHFLNGPYHSGALTGGFLPDWALWMSGRSQENGPYDRWMESRLRDYARTPYSDLAASRGLREIPWRTQWYRQNSSNDPYWKGTAYEDEAHFSKITVPSVSVTGWFDVSFIGSPANYVGMKRWGATREARRPRLIIGPWAHSASGPEGVIDVDGYIVRWFDHFLKGIDNAVDEDPPVFVFVMGENRWHAEQDWPLPQARPTKYYLTSGGHANSRNGDGLLTLEPSQQELSDTYFYDPHRPTLDSSARQSDHQGGLDGRWDTNDSAGGDDVLVYQTPPLGSAVEVVGPIEATLYAATSARDTDWMVRLVDVHPDGRALILADGVMRARSRDPLDAGRFNSTRLSTIEPGSVYEYTIRFWRGTANLFQTGHRIRVEISSSWYPFFLPNLNSGADNLATVPMSRAVIARQSVHHGPEYPSHVLLPILLPQAARVPGSISIH